MRTTAQQALSATLSVVTDGPRPEYPPAVNGAQAPAGVNHGGTRKRSVSAAARARKREPEEQGAFLFRMLRAAARRAVSEDPGRGLRMLLTVQGLLTELVDDVGVDLVRQQGDSRVADDLTISTGEVWQRQRVNKRWGRTSPAGLRRNGGYGPEAEEEQA